MYNHWWDQLDTPAPLRLFPIAQFAINSAKNQRQCGAPSPHSNFPRRAPHVVVATAGCCRNTILHSYYVIPVVMLLWRKGMSCSSCGRTERSSVSNLRYAIGGLSLKILVGLEHRRSVTRNFWGSNQKRCIKFFEKYNKIFLQIN